MRVGIFNTTDGGAARFAAFEDLYRGELELVEFHCAPTYENLDRIAEEKVEALIYYNPKHEDDAFFKRLSEVGIRWLSTTSTGYDHFNLPAMKKYGIHGANVPAYSPNAVSEHTMLLTLSMLRNYRQQLDRISRNDYRNDGLMARELRNMTVGIIGCGRIGVTTLKCLSGFGPKKIYACDPFEREDVKQYAEYASREDLYAKCDILIFHAVATPENYHMINDGAIAAMKPGMVLINAARGQLFDLGAIIRGLESGKLGGVGMDVIEGEELLIGKHDIPECPHPELKKLLTFPNFTFTQHTAFFTDEAFRDMTRTALQNLLDYKRSGECERELVH